MEGSFFLPALWSRGRDAFFFFAKNSHLALAIIYHNSCQKAKKIAGTSPAISLLVFRSVIAYIDLDGLGRKGGGARTAHGVDVCLHAGVLDVHLP